MQTRVSLRFLAKRILAGLFVLWVVVTATFFLMRFLPGGPFDEEHALADEVKQTLYEQYGLHEPLLIQYGRYFKNACVFDFGESFRFGGRKVSAIILETFPTSMMLGFLAIVISLLAGVPLGAWAGASPGSWIARFVGLLGVIGGSVPSFVLGPCLVLFFSFGQPFSFLRGSLPPALWEGPSYMILPALTLAARPLAIVARLIKQAVSENTDAEFTRTAKAKGLSPERILWRHMLRPSLLPLISYMGPLVAMLLSGSLVVELIFAIPGAGKLLIQGVSNRDYPLVIGLCVVYSLILTISNLLSDIALAVVDPRLES